MIAKAILSKKSTAGDSTSTSEQYYRDTIIKRE